MGNSPILNNVILIDLKPKPSLSTGAPEDQSQTTAKPAANVLIEFKEQMHDLDNAIPPGMAAVPEGQTAASPTPDHEMSTASSADSAAQSIDTSVKTGLIGPCVVASRRLALEICGGCARLTREFCNQGLDGTGIDYKRNKSKPVGPSVMLDLTTTHGQLIMETTLNSGRVAVITAAPPCGTASRAREIPIGVKRRKQGVPQPKPLRTNEFPEGIPGLTGLDAERVETANLLYKWIAGFLLKAHSRCVLIVVENPRNSIMWRTKWFVELAQAQGMLAVIFQACMHGGKRDKVTKLLCNFASLT